MLERGKWFRPDPSLQTSLCQLYNFGRKLVRVFNDKILVSELPLPAFHHGFKPDAACSQHASFSASDEAFFLDLTPGSNSPYMPSVFTPEVLLIGD